MPFNISFLSDLGALDAAVVRAVLHGLAPEARVLDIDHELPPYDLRAAGFALLQIIQYLPEGALIVAVDPRAGHPEQRYIAVQAGELTIFAPDNGVIASAVGLLGGSTESVELNNAEHHLGGFAPTFAARDILAPSAAAFANGTALTELGTLVDPNSLVPALMNLPTEEDNQCTGAVWNIDRFGNCALNIDPASLDPTAVERVHGYEQQSHDMTVLGFISDIVPTTFVGAFTGNSILPVLFLAVVFGFFFAAAVTFCDDFSFYVDLDSKILFMFQSPDFHQSVNGNGAILTLSKLL